MSIPTRHGMTIPFDGVPLSEHREWFQELADLGYTDVWSSEANGTDAFTPMALAAAWVPTLRVGCAIAPAYTRGPGLMAMSVASMEEAAPGRFAFGIGQALGRMGGGNSLDNTLRVARVVPADWVLVDVRMHAVRNGFGHGLVHLWSQDGTLLAIASQSCSVKFWTPEIEATVRAEMGETT